MWPKMMGFLFFSLAASGLQCCFMAELDCQGSTYCRNKTSIPPIQFGNADETRAVILSLSQIDRTWTMVAIDGPKSGWVGFQSPLAQSQLFFAAPGCFGVDASLSLHVLDSFNRSIQVAKSYSCDFE
jgi:hypothetical protein